MKPGVTVAQVDQDLKHIAGNLAKQYPNSNSRHDSAAVETELAALIGDTRTALTVVLGAVALVLLIACANIANLLLARMRERQREIAVRAALGADRKRIIRQLLVESLALSTVGGLAGCGSGLCGHAGNAVAYRRQRAPRGQRRCGSARTRLRDRCCRSSAGLIFGIVPAITASKTDLVSYVQGGWTHGDLASRLAALVADRGASRARSGADRRSGTADHQLHEPAAHRARFQSRPSADVLLRIARRAIQTEAARVLSRLLREGACNAGRAIGWRRHGSAHDQ